MQEILLLQDLRTRDFWSAKSEAGRLRDCNCGNVWVRTDSVSFVRCFVAMYYVPLVWLPRELATKLMQFKRCDDTWMLRGWE